MGGLPVRADIEAVEVGLGSGLVVGLVYRTVLCATALYAAGALLSIRAMKIFPSMGAHVVVFLAMLLIARLGAGPLLAPSG